MTTIPSVFGDSRTHVGLRHALIAPDGQVPSLLPGMPLDGTVPPETVVGREGQVTGQPFLGDEDARLQTLLPIHPSFDMAVNIFTYVPGACLPFVETHIMEHGLLMPEGKGIYRLEDRWYPVAAGDCIWMAPYCPQWFTAVGKSRTRYLYYKDVNRPMSP
jgi:(S)-ureidoglycine aminohydrolase